MVEAYDNTYSRIVSWLKILLPLAALGLISTLFLFSSRIDPDGAIPYADIDLEAMAREQRLTGPEYSGMTRDGSALTMVAESVRPEALAAEAGTEDWGGASAAAPHLRLDAADGTRADIRADLGRIDPDAGEIVLSGAVRIAVSSGYTLYSSEITASTDFSDVLSPGAVQGSAPFGTLSAGRMRLTHDAGTGAGEGGHVLVFNDGVKLIYRPQN